MQGRPAHTPGTRLNLLSQRGIGARQFGNPILQSPEVQHRPAHQHGNLPQFARQRNLPPGVFRKARRRIALSRRAQVHQVMGGDALLRQPRFGRADVQPPVDASRVHADQPERQALRKLHRQPRLARTSRPLQQHRLHLRSSGRMPRARYWPRRNMRSNSWMRKARHVGRPWLHWSARGVFSMSRSSAFISSSVSRRLARTEVWQAIVARIW